MSAFVPTGPCPGAAMVKSSASTDRMAATYSGIDAPPASVFEPGTIVTAMKSTPNTTRSPGKNSTVRSGAWAVRPGWISCTVLPPSTIVRRPRTWIRAGPPPLTSGRRRVLTGGCVQRRSEVLVTHELRRVVEHRRARRMILVVMAVDDEPHRRRREAGQQLPVRFHAAVSTLKSDRPGMIPRGHEKDGVVVVGLDPIEIAGDSRDGSHRLRRRLLRLRGRKTGELQQRDDRQKSEERSAHGGRDHNIRRRAFPDVADICDDPRGPP